MLSLTLVLSCINVRGNNIYLCLVSQQPDSSQDQSSPGGSVDEATPEPRSETDAPPLPVSNVDPFALPTAPSTEEENESSKETDSINMTTTGQDANPEMSEEEATKAKYRHKRQSVLLPR